MFELVVHLLKLSSYPSIELEFNSPYGEAIDFEASTIRIVSDLTDPPMTNVIVAPMIAKMMRIASILLRFRLTNPKTSPIFTELTPC